MLSGSSIRFPEFHILTKYSERRNPWAGGHGVRGLSASANHSPLSLCPLSSSSLWWLVETYSWQRLQRATRHCASGAWFPVLFIESHSDQKHRKAGEKGSLIANKDVKNNQVQAKWKKAKAFTFIFTFIYIYGWSSYFFSPGTKKREGPSLKSTFKLCVNSSSQSSLKSAIFLRA